MKKVLTVILILVLVAGGYMSWRYYQEHQNVVSLEKTRDALKQEKAALQKENTALAQDIKTLESYVDPLKAAKESLTAANLALTEQVEEEEAGKVWWCAEYNKELKKTKKLTNTNKALEREIARLQRQNEELRQENERLQAEYDVLAASKSELENQVANLSEDQKKLETEKDRLAKEADRIRTDLAKTEAEKAKIQAEADGLNAKLQEATSKLGNLKEKVASSTMAIKALEENKARLKAANKALREAAETASLDVFQHEQKRRISVELENSFRNSIVLTTVSPEDTLDPKIQKAAAKLLTEMIGRTGREFYPIAREVMEEMPRQDKVESARLLRKSWESWKTAHEELLALEKKMENIWKRHRLDIEEPATAKEERFSMDRGNNPYSINR